MAELNPEFNNEVDIKDLQFVSDTQPEGDAEVVETPTDEIDEGVDHSATNEDTVPDPSGDQLKEELGVGDPEPDAEPEVKPEAPKPQSRFDQRIAQLKEDNRIANERAFNLEKQLVAQQKAFEGVAEPKEEDFERYGDYVKALHGYLDQQKQVEHTRQALNRESETITKGTDAFYRAKLSEGHEKLGDTFIQKCVELGKVIDQHDEAYHTMFNSPEFPAIAVYLAANIAEAQRIKALDPMDQARAILRLEAKFQDGREAPKPIAQNLPKPAKAAAVSRAPAPARQVLSGKTPAARKDPNKMSMEEYAAQRAPKLRTERRTG